jgi:LmbE family N-acetylglucosaminyl deacetylase
MDHEIRVLAIHAHPDDVEFQCAGTLALLKDAGCAVVIATMTPGDCGSAEHDAEAISAIRRDEARAAAAVIGATYVCLEFRDLAIFNDDESRRRVTEAIRRTRPDIILTAPPVDYIADHEMTSALVRDACFAATCPNYVTRQWEPAPALAKIPRLYFVDSLEGRDRDGVPVQADFHVDISRVFAIKRAMLACHASQRNWLMRQHGIDEYLRIQEEWAAHRGSEIGVAWAEGYRRYRGHPYPQDDLLLELIGQDGKGSLVKVVKSSD